MEIKEVCNLTYLDRYELDDLDNRRLYINDNIDNSVVDDTVYHILRYNREDKDIPVSDRKPIILYINSNGGSVPDGYALIDVMLTSKTPVYTVNQGYCYSMGFLIFLAGIKRFSMPSSTFLMHDGSTMGWDSTAKMKDRMDFETNQVEKYTKNYITSRTTIDSKLYDKKYRIEWYMYSQEAKTHGICTHIVGTDCEIDEIL
jgi:ATP-dependent Clp protease protease subunit